jgi:NADH:ubiquinone oxidoreductase subunit 6 (subunit J)
MTERQHAKPATIVWGVILLLIAAVAFAAVMGLEGSTVVWVIVSVGAVLVLCGIVGAAVQLARREKQHPPVG